MPTASVRQWWAEAVEKGKTKHPRICFAEMSSGHAPDPRNVPHLFSAVVDRGFRTYAFATPELRSTFLLRYNGKACNDPLDITG